MMRKIGGEGARGEKKNAVKVIIEIWQSSLTCLLYSILNLIRIVTLWGMLPYSLTGKFECFGGTYCHHLQGYWLQMVAVRSSETLVSTWFYDEKNKIKYGFREP
jgi:hypothetical protein